MSVMPDLCTPTRGVRHRIDSAFPSLLRLGVDVDRIVVESVGPGWPEGTVMRQEPAAGTPLTSQTRVVLSVAGEGGIETLPYPLRDGDDQEFRVDRLFALFDNPLQKLGLFVRDAGDYLALRPGDPVGALRWIEEIFCLPSEPWPEELWYSVALLLPSLHGIAGRADAVPLALQLVFGLPVARVQVVSETVALEEANVTRLGSQGARLGVDTIAGGGVRVDTALEVVIGPVDLSTYRKNCRPDQRQYRHAVYRLVLPSHMNHVTEQWRVGDPSRPASLGGAEPAVLGVNSYLGQPKRNAV